MGKIGALGEKFVGEYLQQKGYLILHYNWRCQWGEIDLIAQNKAHAELIFIEVKTRSVNNWDENGLLAITPKKQTKIETTAQCFLAENPDFADVPCRFDVAIVKCHRGNLTLVCYLESAF